MSPADVRIILIAVDIFIPPSSVNNEKGKEGLWERFIHRAGVRMRVRSKQIASNPGGRWRPAGGQARIIPDPKVLCTWA